MPTEDGMKDPFSHSVQGGLRPERIVRGIQAECRNGTFRNGERTAVITLKCLFQEMAKELGAWIPGCQQ